MTTETTPLTSNTSPGPSYVFPGVSPRSRRHQMRQFQCCICTLFLGIIIVALVIATSYSGWSSNTYVGNVSDRFEFLDDVNNKDSSLPEPLNLTQILDYLLILKQPIRDETATAWTLPAISDEDMAEAVSFGVRALGDKELFEETMQTTPINSPAFRHFRAISTTPEARKLSRRGYVEYHATFHLANKFRFNKTSGRSNIGIGPIIKRLAMVQNVSCNYNAKYRTTNGYCNNKGNPVGIGSALIPYRRAVQPDYGDGIASPRLSYSGSNLQSARQVSLRMHRPKYRTDLNFTVMLAVFGQFLDHDMTATALTSAQDGDSINCCTVPLNKHPECFPVEILPSDPYYDLYNVTCMNFVRSAAAPTGRFGPRQQLNQATAFIDGSAVYGNTELKQNLLRSKQNGTLRMFVTEDNRELLPLSTNPGDGCNREKMNQLGRYCFDAGDDRANENLLLTSLHLLFARHHNYLARGLQGTNSDWDDETVFQEARKILGAQLQHITYNEFLPILLGYQISKAKGICPQSHKTQDTYDPETNPSIANNFAGAAFRFAHTLLPDLFRVTRDNSTPEHIQLHRMLFNPFSLWEQKGIDKAIGSAVNTAASKVSRYVSKELTEKLFEGTAEDKMPVCGLDLVSLNIQRGRDHGLPSYPVFRRHCRLPPTDTWDQMKSAVDADSFNSMQQIYESPLDVDVYTGALSEPPLDGAIFGPLLSCLVSDQFIRTKRGDSFWYERTVGSQKFSKMQLNEIYKTTLAGIICRNADDVQQTQKFVMKHYEPDRNSYIDCEQLKYFNFTPWSKDSIERKLWKVKVSDKQSLVSVILIEGQNITVPNKPLI